MLDGKIKNKSNSTISHCVPIKLNNSEKMISSSQNNLMDWWWPEHLMKGNLGSTDAEDFLNGCQRALTHLRALD